MVNENKGILAKVCLFVSDNRPDMSKEFERKILIGLATTVTKEELQRVIYSVMEDMSIM